MKITPLLFLLLLSTNSFCQTWEIYNSSNSGIPSNAVSGISISENNKVWISTLSGVASFDTIWQTHGINNNPSSHLDKATNIWCIDSLVWVGTKYDGLWSFDGVDSWTLSAGSGIVGLGIDSNDTLWILHEFGGLDKWNGTNWEEIIGVAGYGESLLIDSKDTIWLLSRNTGLKKYAGGVLTEYNNTWDSTMNNYIPDASLYDIAEDSHGNLWIGSDNKGVIKYDGEEFTYYDTTNSNISSNRIRSIAIDINDVLWIGSYDNGISKYDGFEWTNYNTINSPLSSNHINSIAIGSDGKIWIANGYNENGGGNGIAVLDEGNNVSGGILPNAPSELILKGISVEEVKLSWADNSDNETGFIIERSMNIQNNFEQIKYINRNITIHTDNSVTSGNIYYYRIAAVNSIDTSSFTNIDSITPKYCIAGAIIYNCYANVTKLIFNDLYNSVFNSRTGYYDYLDLQTEVRPGQTIMMTVSFDRYTWSTTEFIAGEIYIDWNLDGVFTDGNELVFQNLKIDGKETFSFPVHVPDNAVEGITRIRTRTDDITHKAIGPCGYAEETQDYTLIITSPISLTKPTGLSALGLTSNQIELVWNDNSLSEKTYYIERSIDSIHFDQGVTVGSNTIEYIDSGLTAGTKYYYRVAAISNSDTSEFSDVISVKTLSVDFERITEGGLVANAYGSVGAFWNDYNNDNRPDIFLGGENLLFTNENGLLNNSELSFDGFGSAAWSDYDNDGYVDMYITSYSFSGGSMISNATLFRNNGNNSFEEIILFEADGQVTNCVWLDFNNDGKLDIFLSCQSRYGTLYVNNGDDTFTEQIKLEGASGYSTFADYDNDNDMDLLVCRSYSNLLFDNNGDGTFTQNQNSQFTLLSKTSRGASWGDIDNDGDLDLFIANGMHDEENNSLFINNGDGSFYEVSAGSVVNNGGESYGSSFCDIDNDGNLDLVVSNYQQRNYLYMGNGDGTFQRINQSIIENEFNETYSKENPSMGCAFGDFNQDGFSDLFIAGYGSHGLLYKNSGNSNNWIKLKLIGNQSNKSAIGAKIKLKAGDNFQYREITTQTGFAGQNELVVNFGIGKTTSIDSIIILWPSGIKQVLSDVSVNQFLEITESDNTSVNYAKPDLEIYVFPNPVKDYIIIENKGLSSFLNIELSDLNGRVFISQKFFKNEIRLDTGVLLQGMYLLKISDEKSVIVKKILKE